MLTQIGDGAGWHVLDLCCGIGGITDVLSEWVGEGGSVVGVDLDVAKLQRARASAKEKQLSNVEFMEANAFDTGLPPRSFDLVHTRFAISVIQSGLGILDHMLTLVRPDGVVFVEEANTHYDAMRSINGGLGTSIGLDEENVSGCGGEYRNWTEFTRCLS